MKRPINIFIPDLKEIVGNEIAQEDSLPDSNHRAQAVGDRSLVPCIIQGIICGGGEGLLCRQVEALLLMWKQRKQATELKQKLQCLPVPGRTMVAAFRLSLIID